ncbi:MAG: DUF362 domain-containing protein [Pirellulales bacterium]|nr:DUF362 domain-containing protein [Pirellulales bacterium]
MKPLDPTVDELQNPSRRAILALGGAALASVAGVKAVRWATAPHAEVFLARNQRYDGSLVSTIRDGLLASGLQPRQFRGKRVLLKPNMVEPTRRIPYMTTNPAVILAASEVFRRWGASVQVGEAPGHVRDTEMALIESGIGEALHDARLAFADLNYEQVAWRKNRGRVSPLRGIYLPQTVLQADYVVSMPKMKTHHWVGVTCSMKNLYGVLPGIKYGWPKNVLHHNGIPQTVVDINATLPNTLAIVDGIDCMEGDGPILGSKKQMGLILVGKNLPAVDATAARIMGLVPERISYLQLAADRLGPLAENRITQRGEPWQSVHDPFKILDQPNLRKMRAHPDGPLVS